MSNQIISYGASVERSLTGEAESYVRIPECKGVAIPVTAQEYAEVTNLDSPGGYREYIKGLKDLGEITLTCGYTSEGYAQQVADNQAPDAIFYRVTLRPAPDQTSGDVFVYRGFPTPTPVENGLGEAIGMDVVIRTTGDVDWTAGTPRP